MLSKIKRGHVIKCPYCNYEYTPAEIYLPNVFFGRPESVIRDDAGKILGFHGKPINTKEEFECDNCNNTFTVEATLSFKTELVTEIFENTDLEAEFLAQNS